ncbi:MAG TPA: serine hydrolase domain-containing protein [Solirubrobacteraceae bacterium]
MEAALRENLTERGELGSAVTVSVAGRVVVDLWCGWADRERSRRWEADTVVNVYSVGKAMAGLCVLMLLSRRLLELDAPVAEHWPEFAQAGKGQVTVRQLLSHQAGLAAIERELPDGSLYDWAQVTDALAEQRPWWTPGEGHGYHVHTFGFLLGELVRRVAGETIGSFLRREVAKPLDADVSYGLARSEWDRCADYLFDSRIVSSGDGGGRVEEEGVGVAPSEGDARLKMLAYLNPPGANGIDTVNSASWREAELPSANMHANARGIARVYAALLDGGAPVDGTPLVDREVLAQATSEMAAGEDLVLGRRSRFGLGFQLSQPERPLGPNGGSFGHFGAGGSLGFADPAAELAFAYVTNRGGPQWQDPRNRALIDAVYEALADG